MALEGSLQVFKLPEILQMIALQQKTGILTVQGESDIVAVSFLKGQVVAADALNQTVEERLGKVLIARGQLRPEDLAAVVSDQLKTGSRPIDLLVSGSFVTRPQVLAALRSQTAELLLEILRWRLGDFKFYSGEEVSYEEGFDPISVQELIVGSLPVEPLAALPKPPTPAPVAAPVEVPTAKAVGPAVLSIREFEVAPPLPAPAASAVRSVERAATATPRVARSSAGPVILPGSSRAPALDGDPGEAGKRAPRQRQALPPRRAAPLSGLVAVATLGGLVVTLLLHGGRLALPIPGQAEALALQEKVQRVSQYQKLDGAARTYFLLEGRYPENLKVLVDLGLLARADLVDEAGRPLAYSTSGLQYSVRPVSEGEAVDTPGLAEAVSGNFLLDAEFLRSIGRSQEAPLVLLD